MNQQCVIEVEDLFAGYEGKDVLRGVNLSLYEGEILGVVGPNGSGKSTLIRAITQGLNARAGTLQLRGAPVQGFRPHELARTMSVVPQSALLPDGFTALEVTLMGRSPYLRLLQSEGPEDLAIARRSMLQTDTLALADRPTNELSGGERQRVIVARALTQQAPVLLLDEPTVHLDIGQQSSLLDLVRELTRQQSLSVIAVIHDLSLAAQYCDRLLMLDHGVVVASGAVPDVLRADTIGAVYGVEVRIIDHPDTGKPVVLPVPGERAR
jgi:iron complex transport system ATP-binding protein